MTLPLPDSVAAELGVQAGDSYRDRLKPASYRSPSGETIRFDCEEVRRNTDLRGTAYSFPGVDGAFIQRTGFGMRGYPIRAYFWGAQHDLAATAFEAACLEQGKGTLSHPVYGTFKVDPFGVLGRRNDLVREANQSIVEVTFFRSLEALYPGVNADRGNEIFEALGDFDVAAAQQYADGTALTGTIEQASAIDTVTSFLDTVDDSLSSVAAATDSARAQFQDGVSLVRGGLATLVGQPLLLASNVLELVKAPGRALAGLQAQLEAYQNLAQSLTSSRQASEAVSPAVLGAALSGLSATNRNRAVNNVRTAELFAMGASAGSVVATIEGSRQTRSRADAQAAAIAASAQFDDLVAWRDTALPAVGATDPGGAYQSLHKAVTLTAGNLLEVSLTLLPERVHVTDRPRTIIDLAAELFGEVDSRLNELIEDNGLTGSEIIELPTGTAISYFAEAA